MPNLRFISKRFLMIGAAMMQLLISETSLQAVWEQPPVVVSDPTLAGAPLGTPVLNVSPFGNAIAVWAYEYSHTFPDEVAIGSAYYIQGLGWQPPQIISNLGLNVADGPLYEQQGDPDIAFNSSGYAVAVWEGTYNIPPDALNVVIAAIRNSNGVWGPVQNISDQSGDFIATNANVTMNEAGTALVAYVLEVSGDAGAWIATSFLPFGGSWTAPILFTDGPGSDRIVKPYPFINPSGNAVVTWKARNEDEGIWFIRAATYNATTATWSPQIDLDSSFNGDAIGSYPRCSMDANGNAVAIWVINNIVKISYFNGTSWGLPIVLGPGAKDADSGPSVVMDLLGNATAVWGGTISNPGIWASSRLPNGSWTPPQLISAPGVPGVEDEFTPFQSTEPLAVNPITGDVIAIWERDNTTLYAAIKPFGQNWLAPEIVFSGTPTGGATPNVGITTCGFAISLWQNYVDEPSLIFSSVNNNTIPVVPSNARRTQCCEKFAMQTRCINFLTWDSGSCIAFYNIYRDGVLIATVPNTQTTFEQIDPVVNKNSVYTISAVNIFGAEGPRVPFIFIN